VVTWIQDSIGCPAPNTTRTQQLLTSLTADYEFVGPTWTPSGVMSLQQHEGEKNQGIAPGIVPGSEQHNARFSNKVAPAPSQHQIVTISHEQPSLRQTVEDQEINTAVPVSNLISPELRAALKCLGMTDGALASWHTFHVSPVCAMLHFFISGSLLTAAFAYLQSGTPLNFLYITVPNICSMLFLMGYLSVIWRYGPAAAKSRLYIMTLPVSWTCMSMALLVRWAPHACTSNANITAPLYCLFQVVSMQ
jgi:hypothetical protein